MRKGSRRRNARLILGTKRENSDNNQARIRVLKKWCWLLPFVIHLRPAEYPGADFYLFKQNHGARVSSAALREKRRGGGGRENLIRNDP
jgi:hypothetical protein